MYVQGLWRSEKMPDHANGKTESDNMRDKVSEWLYGLGWKVDPMKHGETLWAMQASFFDTVVVIAHPSRYRGRFVLHLKRGFSDADYERLSSLPDDEKAQFIYKLYSKLCATGMLFHLDGAPIPTSYFLEESIFYESASQEKLARGLLNLTLGERLVHIIKMKALGTLLQPFELGVGVTN